MQGKILEGYRDQLSQQSGLANTFDFPEATTEARARIENIFEELSMAKDVWDTVSLCDRQFEVWKKTLWNDIDTDVMEDASKAFVKEVRKHKNSLLNLTRCPNIAGIVFRLYILLCLPVCGWQRTPAGPAVNVAVQEYAGSSLIILTLS